MSLLKITFDSASVTSKRDADVNHFLAGNQNGIIKNLAGYCAASILNNNIIFESGYIQAYGRRVFVESGTKINISLDGTAYGYVFARIDIGNNTVTLEKRESASDFPSLTQEDLVNGGLIYELALARYIKTTSSLTLDSTWLPDYIVNFKAYSDSCIEALKTATASAFGCGGTATFTKDGEYRYVSGLVKTQFAKAILILSIGNDTVIIPGNHLSTSKTTVTYFYYGTQYTTSVRWLTDGRLSIQLGDATHRLNYISWFKHGGY